MRGGPIASIAIVGSGVAAAAAAAAFAVRLPGVRVTVVEDPQAPLALADLVGTCNPSVVDFHEDAVIDERTLMRQVDSGFRLGARFDHWTVRGGRYWHCHGEHGATIGGTPFHHHWLRLASGAGDFQAYSVAATLAGGGKFVHPQTDDGLLARFGYGFNLDVPGYANFLRAVAAARGVATVRGCFTVDLDPHSGHVRAFTTDDGTRVAADLYVDTVGTLADRIDARRTNWSQWLPVCHIGVAREALPADPATTESVAASGTGWIMRTPLRRAIHHVAVATEKTRLPFEATLTRSFTQGRRVAPWNGNVVAIGDAATTLEPIDGVALHIVHAQVDRIVAALPGQDFAPTETAFYNDQTAAEADRLRDFVALRYAVSDRPEPMWRDLVATEPPAGLAHDLRLFRERGHLPVHDGESFSRDSWLSVLIGQGVRPRRIDPVAAELPRTETASMLGALRREIAAATAPLPAQRDYLARYLGERR